MKLVDLNLLIYAIDADSPLHERARPWLEEIFSGNERVALAWAVLLGFVRLTTSAAVFERPLAASEALDYVESWLAQPVATVVHPGERHGALLRELLADSGTAGNLTSDAHLAALAIENGAELHSADADFSRFPGLRWVNPLG